MCNNYCVNNPYPKDSAASYQSPKVLLLLLLTTTTCGSWVFSSTLWRRTLASPAAAAL
ncbi:hypothetical protein FF38_00151 [Lucilia cuprina]|uniref:Uncharacterized protein n=1 Tax=Lucilia cuprina TaxID=7375 RepID=A0A0L0BVF4_LUCCU|nr:hypothetical protein FF38_00151 [Lucilia cuprina]